jgi:protease-4
LSKKRLLVAVILLLVGVSVLLAGQLGPSVPVLGRQGGPAVGVVYLEGPFAGGRSTSGLIDSFCGADTIVGLLEEASQDPRVRALVVRINSPGGTAAAAQEVAAAVGRVRRAGLPVVASMADVAASGGYWVAAQADVVVANPATITGSIGVIMELVNLQDLMGKLGVDVEVIKSGPFKDIGSSSRPLEEAERRILQGMVDDIFEQFVAAVAVGRGLEPERVRELADGRVFTGRQAQELKLVDELGDLEDAIRLAAGLAGLESWTVVELLPRSGLGLLLRLLGGTWSEQVMLGLPAQIWWGRQVVRYRKANF